MITTPQELARVAQNVGSSSGKYYQLQNDIDLSEVCGDTLGSWTPIGSPTTPFHGTFDGNGNTVKNLYINSSQDLQGLFGQINNATVTNLNVEGEVHAASRVGGIVGYATSIDSGSVTSSRVNYCTFKGKVSGYSQTAAILRWAVLWVTTTPARCITAKP